MGARLSIGAVPLGAHPVIVAAGGESDVDALLAADGAHAVELRADLFATPSVTHVTAALERLRAGGRPILFTARAEAEGGRPMPDAQRAALYDAALPLVQAIDVEIASTSLAARLVPQARAAGVLVVLSAHDFLRTPDADALLATVARAFDAGADVAKLAAHAVAASDLAALLACTIAARERGVATLGMGPWGPLSRLVLPAAGSLLTYASAGQATAPGQLPVGELAALLERLGPA
ncbi:MAG: type I 3-dehydroquinate dehydratase [bacterium]|nr:type I 3-dehydroquinate dehydratase [bacterium]